MGLKISGEQSPQISEAIPVSAARVSPTVPNTIAYVNGFGDGFLNGGAAAITDAWQAISHTANDAVTRAILTSAQTYQTPSSGDKAPSTLALTGAIVSNELTYQANSAWDAMKTSAGTLYTLVSDDDAQNELATTAAQNIYHGATSTLNAIQTGTPERAAILGETHGSVVGNTATKLAALEVTGRAALQLAETAVTLGASGVTLAKPALVKTGNAATRALNEADALLASAGRKALSTAQKTGTEIAAGAKDLLGTPRMQLASASSSGSRIPTYLKQPTGVHSPNPRGASHVMMQEGVQAENPNAWPSEWYDDDDDLPNALATLSPKSAATTPKLKREAFTTVGNTLTALQERVLRAAIQEIQAVQRTAQTKNKSVKIKVLDASWNDRELQSLASSLDNTIPEWASRVISETGLSAAVDDSCNLHSALQDLIVSALRNPQLIRALLE